MPTIQFRFPGGRYHATPGGHHVNEGQVEWPPSPWRIIRALISTGYTTQGWQEPPPTAVRLLSKLADSLPSYHLPSASAAHSRHYMPQGSIDKVAGREKTSSSPILDTWVNIGDGILTVYWPTELRNDESALLANLCANLGYLGRSESWVEACLTPEDAPPPADSRLCQPCTDNAAPPPGYEQVLVTAPLSAADFQAWRDPLLAEAVEALPLPEGKKFSAKQLEKLHDKRKNATAPFPTDLIDALQWDTARWKGHRWGQPPGSQQVLYQRSTEALEIGVPARPRSGSTAPVACMLLALATESRNRSALPPLTRALPQAEMIHRSLVGKIGNGEQVNCPEIIGKDAVGHKLKGHQHAYILPLDLYGKGDDRLDHVLIYAKGGLGAKAQQAIRSLRSTWQKKGQAIQLAVVGAGSLKDLHQLPDPLAIGVQGLLGPESGASVWTSATPFVPTRFLKKRGPNELTAQVQRELENHGFPPAHQIEVLPWDAQNARLRHTIRSRKQAHKAPPIDCGYAIQLTFNKPITGPIALGYASHFGLGRFQAVSG